MAGPGKKPAVPMELVTPNEEAENQRRLQELSALDEQQRRRRPGGPDWVPFRYIERGQGSKRKGYRGAAYDSRLILREGANAELTLILKIFFQRVDPTPEGGRQRVVINRGTGGGEFRLAGITEEEMREFRFKALYQANETWRGVGLVTPNDFAGFDWPKGNPTVRPNVNCSLRCELALCPSAAHATVRVGKPSEPGFRSFVNLSDGTSTWDLTDIVWRPTLAHQDRTFLGLRMLKEKIWQHMVPHEVGHLLGLEHIGKTLEVGSCFHRPGSCSNDKEENQEYGLDESFPMWFARNIMGAGSVVHACNLYPWSHAMEQHTGIAHDRWIHAGTHIPPRAIKTIPKERYTLANSPYTGGFQEQGRY
jgi:hypothetical protein